MIILLKAWQFKKVQQFAWQDETSSKELCEKLHHTIKFFNNEHQLK